ncbi:MAG: hypothetical protein Q8P50_04455 [Bacillota bacterium]|nr:hypothetical protein [Bacillota bacterium]
MLMKLDMDSGGFPEIAAYDCTTVMSTCVGDLTGPQPDDEKNMRRVHGVPEPATLSRKAGTTNTALVEAQDVLLYDAWWKVETWKWNSTLGQWDYLDQHITTTDGYWLHFEENVVANHGPGIYIFQVWVQDNYPNGTQGLNYGGFTNQLDFY